MIPTTTTTITTYQEQSPHHHHHPAEEEEDETAIDTTVVAATITRKRCQAELRLSSIDTTHTSSSQSSSSLLDFQSLQSSLKRVRLSMSPGELRLERDLRNLVTCEGWNKVEQHVWLFGGDKSSKLEQTPGDPLRLVLLTNQISVFLQIPRRYPHRPPVVSRVIYPASAAGASSESNSSTTTNSNGNSRHLMLLLAASSPPQLHQHHHQKGQQPQRCRVEHIVVNEAPPIPANDFTPEFASLSTTLNAPNNSSSNNNSVMESTTVIYNEWSPVKRLGDLLRFIIEALEPKQDRQDYGCRYLESPHSSSDEALTMSWDASESITPMRHHLKRPSSTITPNDNIATHRLKLDDENGNSQHPRNRQELQVADQLAANLKSSSMDGCFESNVNATTTAAMESTFFVEEHKSMSEMEYLELDITSGGSSDTTRKSYSPLPFPPNRFDVGYAKATTSSTFTDHSTTGVVSRTTLMMHSTSLPFSFDWTGLSSASTTTTTTTATTTASSSVADFQMDL